MNKQKLLYEAPAAELLVVRFEVNILSYNGDNHTEYYNPIDGGDI